MLNGQNTYLEAWSPDTRDSEKGLLCVSRRSLWAPLRIQKGGSIRDIFAHKKCLEFPLVEQQLWDLSILRWFVAHLLVCPSCHIEQVWAEMCVLLARVWLGLFKVSMRGEDMFWWVVYLWSHLFRISPALNRCRQKTFWEWVINCEGKNVIQRTWMV